MQKMNIFVSYASEDKDVAEQIYLNLVKDGHQVFFDRTELPAGGDYTTRIRNAFRKSHLFIFLISPDAVAKSSYALTELKFAREKWQHPDGHVLPVMVRGTDYSLIPNYLKTLTVLEPEGNVAAEVAGQVANWPPPKRKHLIKIVSAASIVAILISIVIYLSLKPAGNVNEDLRNANSNNGPIPDRTIAIHPDFELPYERYKNILGEPEEAKALEYVYYAQHQRARAIWDEERGVFYLLDKNHTWKQLDDPFANGKAEETYFFDEENSGRLKTPKGSNPPLYPPWAGVAKGWTLDPDSWSGIGWRIWHCYHLDGATHIQRFKHGIIIGGFRRSLEDKQRALVFILLEDGKWVSEALKIDAPPCVEPPTNKASYDQFLKDRTKP
jgi:hypothetical protein